MSLRPYRGEIWIANLKPVIGHEQDGTRPVLVVSNDSFNTGPADLVWIVPLTTRNRHIPMHVCVEALESGLNERSYILCEKMRSISKQRLQRCVGSVSAETLAIVADNIRVLLDLD